MPFAEVASALGLGASSGVRAGLSLLVVGLLGRLGWVDVPPELQWLTTTMALGAVGALTVLEAAAERDDDLPLLLEHAQFALRGVGGAVAAMAASRAGLAAPDDAQLLVAGAVGAAVAMGTHGLRMRLHRALLLLENDVVHPRRWVLRLEQGGVLGLALAAVLAPFLALALVALAAALFVVGARLAKRAEAVWRRPCPACGAAIRVEASRCPACRADVPVAPGPLSLSP